jgi:hypothetical protein
MTKAAEFWWAGKTDAWESAVDKMVPPQLDVDATIRAARVKTSRFREGYAFRASVIEESQPLYRHFNLWKEAKMIELASEEAALRAVAAMEKLDKRIVDFRSRTANDLASIKAASQRVQTETQSMAEKYAAAQNLLTSPEFERAVANAERMAAALEAISKLSETKLSVAVFSGGGAPMGA